MVIRWLIIPLLVMLGSCATYEEAVRTRAANEFNCDETKVRVEELGANAFRAKGCGQGGTYVCSGYGTSQVTCIRER